MLSCIFTENLNRLPLDFRSEYDGTATGSSRFLSLSRTRLLLHLAVSSICTTTHTGTTQLCCNDVDSLFHVPLRWLTRYCTDRDRYYTRLSSIAFLPHSTRKFSSTALQKAVAVPSVCMCTLFICYSARFMNTTFFALILTSLDATAAL